MISRRTLLGALAAAGALPMTPDQFRSYIKTETARQGAVIKANNISAE